MNQSTFVYGVYPFHIVSGKGGNLFDPVQAEHLVPASIQESISGLRSRLSTCCYKNFSANTENSTQDSGKASSQPSLGDPTKYYDFIRNHFGAMGTAANLEVYELEQNRILPSPSFESDKNFGARFSEHSHRLGNSGLRLTKMDSVNVLINPLAGIGSIIFGFEITSPDGESCLKNLASSDFFRNIGWRQGQGAFKKGNSQYKKHALWVGDPDSTEPIAGLTFYEIFTGYFGFLSDHIRFYQDRLTLLYTFAPTHVDDCKESEYQHLFFEILRIPDKNTNRFSFELEDPDVVKVGRNVIFSVLNEGAVVIQLAAQSGTAKSVANKYLPAFILALNQREVLLKTMQRIATLDTSRLLHMDEQKLSEIRELKTTLLVIQLKQLFYSVSNLQEVERFFVDLQAAFSIEIMLKENEQSIREIYNLLESKRNEEAERHRLESDRREKENALDEGKRGKIVNTILGAIACLGLFSFLKDLLPFFNDAQYYPLYKTFTIALPFFIMSWLIWYMFGKKER